MPIHDSLGPARLGRAAVRGAAALTALTVLVSSSAQAQRRPGVGMGFYSYAGRPSVEVEGGSVVSSSAFAEAPTFALSVFGSTALYRGRNRAWIVGLRATPLNLGNRGCVVLPGLTGCQDVRYEERAALVTGGAFDIRSTLLRATIGTALFDVQGRGARLGANVRLDFTAPRQGGSSPTLFLTRTFLGSERGESAGMTTVGAGYRWVRKK